ncbi:MAG: hypothetical protein NC302_10800 [Bacteroidales bacterium]|nr:hypothetical protein [Bacteroidales bacterium]MCM1415069.1 hypothetical protein [bacterium]MCM1424266.1 hypothetical protein [bacterium]
MDAWKRGGIFLIKEFFILVICVFVGIALLAGAYLVPPKYIFQNVNESAITLYRENLGRHVWEDARETMLDIYTDGLIINEAYTYGEDGRTDIFLNPYMTVDETNPMNSLYEVAALANDDYEIVHYGRYWHGYLVIIRPLLVLLNYVDIRRLNMMLQIILVFFFVWETAKNKGGGLRILIPFLGMYLFLSPVTLFGSLQYAPCFYIMMVMLIVLSVWKDRLNDEKRLYLFLLAGILTAYFDFLTYPFVTLGVPLLAYLGLERECLLSAKRALRDVFFYTLSWGFGYVGMWSAKWVAASLLTEENIILNALEKLKFRSGHFESGNSMRNLFHYMSQALDPKMTSVMLVLLLAFIVVLRIKEKRPFEKGMLPGICAMLLVSLYPFVWYYCTLYHSTELYYFTYRELGISVFGILMMASTGMGSELQEDS